MRANKGTGFTNKERAEATLEALRALTPEDRIKSAKIEPTIFSTPDRILYEIHVLYHDLKKTPFTVSAVIKSLNDVEQLIEEGCVHDYSLGQLYDHKAGGVWSVVQCHTCKGEITLDEDEVIQYILNTNNNELKYDRWKK